jgi:NADH-quinone oxidoreductase subunit E
MRERIEELLTPYTESKRGSLIPILQRVQGEFGYLPQEALPQIGRFLGISANEIYGVATFYAQFRFTKPGEHMVKVCLGTACHVRGGPRILDAVGEDIKIAPGETSADGKFTLERVACFGCCALAPVMVVDGTVHSKMTPPKVKEVLSSYRG